MLMTRQLFYQTEILRMPFQPPRCFQETLYIFQRIYFSALQGITPIEIGSPSFISSPMF